MGVKGCSDSGLTLVEVLVSTAVASVALAGAAGLLAASARAVADAELETTATWVASRTVEEWRSQLNPPLDGHLKIDRDGQVAAGEGVFQASWSAHPEPGSPGAWRISATVTSSRLRHRISTETVVQRAQP